DIPLLVEFFLKRFNEENAKSVTLAHNILDILGNYEWPGNVRELENTIERLVVMARGNMITESELPITIRNQTIKARYGVQLKDALPSTIEDIEKTRILDALKKTGWVQARAARMLGLSNRQIGYKIKKYGIQTILNSP
ncbi:MAG TPA: helix-turn-helix domain-containing protein, partial [Dissulfurispiraceae bacterium]|nr:helix-turn-helix domain-containing protein [Dissulfurispiraceae bacterium]